MDNQTLIEEAKKVMRNSYSPYSNFPVGAALLTKNGKIYVGTNVENASYGATICAERSAILTAISQGENPKDFEKIAIISKMKEYTYPCFICRQTMAEFFHHNVKVIMATIEEEYKEVLIDELLPYKFTKKELKNV